jgi:iron complex outermembrane recepter protein
LSFISNSVKDDLQFPAGFSVQAGIKNLFDRNNYHTAGYPEMGRNWYWNGRFTF